MPKVLENFAFIDGNNLYLGVKNLGWKLDTAKFYKYLEEKYNVKKAYYFVGEIRGNDWLYDRLRNQNYELILKPTSKVKNLVKGNCDSELILHTMIHFNEFKKAVIVSGDGDFGCLIEYLESLDKLRNVIVPDLSSCSYLIRRFSKGKISPLNLLQSRLQKV